MGENIKITGSESPPCGGLGGRKAMITGQSGQDGYYMTQLLQSKGYEVRRIERKHLAITHLLFEQVEKFMPDEIYNFAGVSNVFNPYADPQITIWANTEIPVRLLNIIYLTQLYHDKKIKLFQASSSLVFGRTQTKLQDENTPREPIYPYGVSKRCADDLVKMYREEKGLFAVSGIFYNHESPRRGDQFFTKKVTNAARRKEKITLGYMNSERDFGYAPDFMQAAWLMLQADKPTDYVIGTGTRTRLHQFVQMAYAQAGLNYEDYLSIDDKLPRTDGLSLCANSNKIREELGWQPTHTVYEIIEKMMQA